MRPVSYSTQSDFCVVLKEEMIPVLVSRVVGQNLHMFMKSHPLMDQSDFTESLRNKTPPNVWKKITN